jgi:hypothetical protein
VRAFIDGPFDGMLRRERSDSRQCHRPVGSATECDGLEDHPFPRKIDKAIHLAPRLPGRAGDKLQGQASPGDLCAHSRSDALNTQMPCHEASNGKRVKKELISIRDRLRV